MWLLEVQQLKMQVSHRILNVLKSVLQFRSFKQPGALSQPTCSNSLMADQWHRSQCGEHQKDRNISFAFTHLHHAGFGGVCVLGAGGVPP